MPAFTISLRFHAFTRFSAMRPLLIASICMAILASTTG